MIIIALTTVMFVALLVLMPLRVRAAFCLNFAQKTLHVKVKLFFVTFFSEKFVLDGAHLDCQGSVDTEIDLTEMETGSGKHYLKAIVMDSVNVTLATNYLAHAPTTMVALEGAVGVATTVACAVTNCRIHVSTQMANQTAVFGEVRLNVTLLAVFVAMIREAIDKRHRAREKSN